MVFERILRWLIFSVIMALMPICFNALSLITRGGPIDLIHLLSRGELLIISAGLSATAVGEVLTSGENLRIPKLISGGTAVIILAIASLYFADISSGYRLGVPMDLTVIRNTSLALFILAVISGVSCIALKEA